MYEYKAKVISVYDGDTIRIKIDLGFGFSNNGTNGKGMSIRLYGINTPEIRGDEKVQGKISRDYLRSRILGKDIVIKTIKDKTGKYGRYLGKIYLNGECINDTLVEKGYGVYKTY